MLGSGIHINPNYYSKVDYCQNKIFGWDYLVSFLNKLDSFFTQSPKFSLKREIVVASLFYNCRTNRKAIFNASMSPNMPENKRNQKGVKKGRKQIFEKSIFSERFKTVERIFAWEDKFKRLLLRLEVLSGHHYALKLIAYSMINLCHFCE